MKKIHYWTDSPSSQYRNRFIFHTVAKHQEMYAISVSWNYFEAGHGKGPCDGLGGSTKRLADEAIRQGKTVIQDAKDFYRWSITSSMYQVSFLYIEKERCEKKREDLKNVKIKPVKNTMKIRAVIGISASELLTQSTSCYCLDCIRGDYCDAWLKVKLDVVENTVNHEPAVEIALETSNVTPEVSDNAISLAVVENLRGKCKGEFVLSFLLNQYTL